MKGDSEDNSVKMMEEIKDLEEQLKKHKKMVSDLKETNKELVEVVCILVSIFLTRRMKNIKWSLKRQRKQNLSSNRSSKKSNNLNLKVCNSMERPFKFIGYHERARTPTMRRISETDSGPDEIAVLEQAKRGLEAQMQSVIKNEDISDGF